MLHQHELDGPGGTTVIVDMKWGDRGEVQEGHTDMNELHDRAWNPDIRALHVLDPHLDLLQRLHSVYEQNPRS